MALELTKQKQRRMRFWLKMYADSLFASASVVENERMNAEDLRLCKLWRKDAHEVDNFIERHLCDALHNYADEQWLKKAKKERRANGDDW